MPTREEIEKVIDKAWEKDPFSVTTLASTLLSHFDITEKGRVAQPEIDKHYQPCPCCGSNVPVHVGDEGTGSFRSVDVEKLEKVVEAVRDFIKDEDEQAKNPCPDYIALYLENNHQIREALAELDGKG